MLSLTGDWINQHVVITVLMSLRFLGVFLVMPLFAFRALTIRMRVVISLMLAYFVVLYLPGSEKDLVEQSPTILSVASEFGIGLLLGWLMRVGLMTIDFVAESLSMQAGLSFAATMNHDPALASGLLGEFLGMMALALAFALNIHLVFLQVMLQSFNYLPVGQWFSALRPEAILKLMANAFALGLVITIPALVVYYLFNMTQAILARVSPQMNLFSVGFPMMIAMAFAIIALLLPSFSGLVARSLEPSIELIKALLGILK